MKLDFIFCCSYFWGILRHSYTIRVHTVNLGCVFVRTRGICIVSSNRIVSVPKAKRFSRGKLSNNFLPPSPVRPLWVVPHEETMRTVKLVVIGSSGVGKTSLRSQVCP